MIRRFHFLSIDRKYTYIHKECLCFVNLLILVVSNYVSKQTYDLSKMNIKYKFWCRRKGVCTPYIMFDFIYYDDHSIPKVHVCSMLVGAARIFILTWHKPLVSRVLYRGHAAVTFMSFFCVKLLAKMQISLMFW